MPPMPSFQQSPFSDSSLSFGSSINGSVQPGALFSSKWSPSPFDGNPRSLVLYQPIPAFPSLAFGDENYPKLKSSEIENERRPRSQAVTSQTSSVVKDTKVRRFFTPKRNKNNKRIITIPIEDSVKSLKISAESHPSCHYVADKKETKSSFATEADHRYCLPKLTKPEYYMVPTIEDLAARERDEQGYCSRVKDFVVGRYGYGSIMFTGETDVRGLELDSIVQFEHKEVVLYADFVWQTLKKAVVTLLNIKFFDKKGVQRIDAAAVEKIEKLLRKKAIDHGAEFLSYDPVFGVWKFCVESFVKDHIF